MAEPDPAAFKTLEVRAELRQVLRDGRPVELGARAFDVLLALTARAGRVVLKDELLDAVWPGLVVEDNNLAVQISTLRRALGPATIRTVPGRGYQWTGGPLQGGPPAATPPASPPTPTDADEIGAAGAAPHPELIGRQRELAWLRQALQHPPAVLSVVGPAGIGKTALVRALVASLGGAALPPADGSTPGSADRPGPVGGQRCEVELAALPPQPPGSAAAFDTAAVAGAVAAALGAPALPAATPLERLLHHLHQRAALGTLPSLVVLDNCEHVLAPVQSLAAAMRAAAPALWVVVTSQAPLKLPQERLLRLDSLDLPTGDDLASAAASAAVVLFCARATAADRRFRLTAHNAAAVVDICRRLEGIPLALELAAGRMPLLGIEGLRTRLSERLRLLRGSDAAAPPRQQTLLAALDWSHALLPPPEQALLRRLSVFSGGFAATAVQQVAADAALDEWAVLDALGALVDKSLVAAHAALAAEPATSEGTALDEPRLHLLETVREYARAKLQDSGEAEAFGCRHAQHFVAVAEAHGSGWLGGDKAATRRTRLARDIDNLRAAMAWCLAHDPPLGLRLAAALMLLWREHGLLAEGRAACAALLQRTLDDPPGPLRMAVQVALGAMAMEQDDAAQMQAMGDQVLHASRATGERRREAHANGLLAHAALSRNDVALATRHFAACLAIYRELDDVRSVAETLNNLAQCHLAEGRADVALAVLHEALPLARSCNHRWTEAAVLQCLGDVSLTLGDEQAAQTHLSESLLLRRGIGHVQQVVMSLQSLALLQLCQRRPAAAASHLSEATRECARHGYGQLDGLCFLAAGAVAAQRGDHDAAVPLLAAGRLRLDGTPIGSRPIVTRVGDETVAATRAALDAGRWQAAWLHGRALATGEVLALALAVVTP